MAGYLGNNFLPARAGELVRTFLISRRSSLSKTYVLTTALSERLMDVIALVLGSSIVLLRMDMKVPWMENLSRSHGDSGRRRRNCRHSLAAYRWIDGTSARPHPHAGREFAAVQSSC